MILLNNVEGRLLYVKGCSRIDSIVLGQHAVYNNLEKRKKKRQESVAVLKKWWSRLNGIL
jgi:hypothetical protein